MDKRRELPICAQVFLIRHGEREDEAAQRWKLKISEHARFDPKLTKKGYNQARLAFTGLFQSWRNEGRVRKVAVFSSPLRRTVGTALMISAADPENAGVEWVFRGLVGKSSDTVDWIPVVVSNGLSDCASQMEYIGGSQVAVEKRALSCASMAWNDGTTFAPILPQIHKMQRHARPSVSSSRAEPTWLRFHRGEILSPMTPKVSAIGIDDESLLTSPASAYENFARDSFHACLDRSVRQAVAEGCDTVIVVTHREGIRSLADMCSTDGQMGNRLKTPYCCIGEFMAAVSSSSVKWDFHGVLTYPLERER